jgi:hypothetical protein
MKNAKNVMNTKNSKILKGLKNSKNAKNMMNMKKIVLHKFESSSWWLNMTVSVNLKLEARE